MESSMPNRCQNYYGKPFKKRSFELIKVETAEDEKIVITEDSFTVYTTDVSEYDFSILYDAVKNGLL